MKNKKKTISSTIILLISFPSLLFGNIQDQINNFIKTDATTTLQIDFSKGYSLLHSLPQKDPLIKENSTLNYSNSSNGCFNKDKKFTFNADKLLDFKQGTIEFYIKVNSNFDSNAANMIFSLYENGNKRLYFRYIANSFHFFAKVTDEGYGFDLTTAEPAFKLGKWYYIVAQWDFTKNGQGKAEVYIDGEKRLKSYKKCKKNNPNKSNAKFFIGTYTGTDIQSNGLTIKGFKVFDHLKYPNGKIINFNLQDSQNYTNNYFATLFEEKATHNLPPDASKKTKELYKKIKQCKEEIKSGQLSQRDMSSKLEEEQITFRLLKASAWDDRNINSKASPLIISPETSMIKIPIYKSPKYTPSMKNQIELFSAKNEAESFQLVCFSSDNKIHTLSVDIDELKNSDSNSFIPANNVKIFNVKGIPHGQILNQPVLIPDPVLPKKNGIKLKPEELACFWVDIKVPYNAKPGLYCSKIIVTSDSDKTISLPIKLKVFDAKLPINGKFQTAFGLAPEYIGKHTPGYGSLSKKEKDALMDTYIRNHLEHKLSPKALWRSVAQAEFLSPKYILKTDGSLVIDFTDWDKKIEKYLPLGLNSILAGQRNWRLTGKDPDPTINLICYVENEKRSRRVRLPFFETLSTVFKAWQKHLDEKGWCDFAYSYAYDEPASSAIANMNKVHLEIGKAAPRIKRMCTSFLPPNENVKNIDIKTPLISRLCDNFTKQEKKAGRKFWTYVCTQPKRPYTNFFISQELIVPRLAFWVARKYSAEGFLYWETAFWAENPWHGHKGYPDDPDSDGCLMYPGPNGPLNSIRLKAIRDGVEDAELLLMLKSIENNPKISDSDKNKIKDLIKIPSDVVTSSVKHTKKPENLQKARIEILEMLEKYSNFLNQ